MSNVTRPLGTRRPLSAALLVVLTALVAACGSSGGETSTAEGASTTTTVTPVAGDAPPASAPPASATPTVPPTTAPPTTAPPTTVPPTTSATTAVPATVAGGLSMGCLQGEWLLKPDRTDLFLATLVPFAPVSVPGGSISMTITGDRVVTFWNVVVRFTVPSGAVETTLDLRQSGTATVDGGSLLITGTTTEGGWGPFTGTLGGVAVNVPAPPVGDIPAMTGGPTQCAGNELSMQFTSGVSDAVAYFERVR